MYHKLKKDIKPRSINHTLVGKLCVKQSQMGFINMKEMSQQKADHEAGGKTGISMGQQENYSRKKCKLSFK
jgi:hypothetical protein